MKNKGNITLYTDLTMIEELRNIVEDKGIVFSNYVDSILAKCLEEEKLALEEEALEEQH